SKSEKSEKKSPSAITIVPVESTNTLLITAPPTILDQIQHMIKNLDIRRRQVMIEVKILEVDHDDLNALGTNWTNIVKGLQRSGHTITHTVSMAGSLTDTLFAYQFNRDLNDGGSIDAAIQFMRSKGLVKIISEPKLLTADNQKAQIKIGQEEPFVKSVTKLNDGSNNTVSDVVYKDIGLEMTITPHINADRDVALEISFKSSSILSSVSVGDNQQVPRTGKREANANVTVKDGNFLIMGGFTERRRSVIEKKVPLLGSVPILGWLFRSKSATEKEVELLIFIIPKVVENESEAQALLNEHRIDSDDVLEAARQDILRHAKDRFLREEREPNVQDKHDKAKHDKK
ncbi:MAG: type II secretion system protein GspD, partial [Lentisphaerae bacterium]